MTVHTEILLIAIAVSIACAIPGVFLVLRRMSMMADAITHTVFLGIVLAFSFILFSKFAEEFAKGGLLPPYVSVWIPNFIYAFIAYYLYKKAPK